MAHKLGANVVVSDGQGLRGAGGADVILATSNSYKATADTLRGLRPDGRLMFIGASDEPFTIPSPGEFLDESPSDNWLQSERSGVSVRSVRLRCQR